MFLVKSLFARRKVVWEFRSTFGESLRPNKYKRWGQKDFRSAEKVHINFSETNQLCLVGLGCSCCQQLKKKRWKGKRKGQEVLWPQTQHLSQECLINPFLLVPIAHLPQPLPQLSPSPVPKLLFPPAAITTFQIPQSFPQTCPGPSWRTLSPRHPTPLFLKLCTKVFSKSIQSSPTSSTSAKLSQAPSADIHVRAGTWLFPVGCCSPPCPSAPPQKASHSTSSRKKKKPQKASLSTSIRESCPNRSPRAGENYGEGNSDIQKNFLRLHSQETEMSFISGGKKNVVFNTHLRCKRAVFGPHPPMLHEGYWREGDVISCWRAKMISIVSGPEESKWLWRNWVFPPNRSQGEFELGFCTTQKTLSCWLFRWHWDHIPFHLLSPVSLKYGFC